MTSFTQPLPSGYSYDMIFVEGDTFWMGTHEKEPKDTSDLARVTLNSYYLAKYPVTQGLWKAVMGEDNNPSYFQGDQRPVESVSWKDTQIFLEKLNRITGKGYRLPSEAQWEFAARGGVKSQGFEYAGSNKLSEVSWYRENSHRESKSVGHKSPNELGLNDMSGNVDEWCQDWYGNMKQRHDSLNPEGPDQGVYRVVRGGGWLNDAGDCRVSNRNWDFPVHRDDLLGFRLSLPVQ